MIVTGAVFPADPCLDNCHYGIYNTSTIYGYLEERIRGYAGNVEENRAFTDSSVLRGFLFLFCLANA